MMHALHAVIGAHLHHVAVAIGHLRMVGHPDTLPRRTGRARPELRNLAPFIMATGRRSVRLRESWSRAEAKREGGNGRAKQYRLHASSSCIECWKESCMGYCLAQSRPAHMKIGQAGRDMQIVQ